MQQNVLAFRKQIYTIYEIDLKSTQYNDFYYQSIFMLKSIVNFRVLAVSIDFEMTRIIHYYSDV